MTPNSKKILFDDAVFQLNPHGGIARFWLNWLPRLREKFQVSILSRTGVVDKFGHSVVPFPRLNWDWAAHDREQISGVCQALRIDYFISSYYTFSLNSRNITVVHDLIPEIYGFTDLTTDWLNRKLAFQVSDMLIPVSKNTSKDLISIYPALTQVVSDEVQMDADVAIFFPRPDYEIELERAKLNIQPGQEYVLMFIQTAPYKNFFSTLASILKLPDSPIVVCLGSGQSLPGRFASDEKIVSLDFIDDVSLARLYSGSLALVYPSGYEGFGYPPRECLRCGSDVVHIGGSSLPESTLGLGTEIESLTSSSLDSAFRKFREKPRQDADRVSHSRKKIPGSSLMELITKVAFHDEPKVVNAFDQSKNKVLMSAEARLWGVRIGKR